MTARTFPLADVLTATTGMLVSPRPDAEVITVALPDAPTYGGNDS